MSDVHINTVKSITNQSKNIENNLKNYLFAINIQPLFNNNVWIMIIMPTSKILKHTILPFTTIDVHIDIVIKPSITNQNKILILFSMF